MEVLQEKQAELCKEHLRSMYIGLKKFCDTSISRILQGHIFFASYLADPSLNLNH